MVNKKGQSAMEFLMTYGLAILAAIVAIAILAWFWEDSLTKNDYFTIYKEECRNETVKINPHTEFIIKKVGYGDLIFNFEEPTEIESLSYKKEVCEKVEVNEIRVYNQKQICHIYYNDRGSYCDISEKQLDKIILKQDLTKEWLEENCECSKRLYCRMGICYSSKVYDLNEEEENMIKCFKYKCGDYYVEVN